MTIERIWLLVNKRRSERGKEPVKLSHIQRIVKLLYGVPEKPIRSPAFGKAFFHKPYKRWDIPAPNDGRPPFKSDNRRR
jgi:hypothetical protein